LFFHTLSSQQSKENILPKGKSFQESDWWRNVVVPLNKHGEDVLLQVQNSDSITNNNHTSFPTHSSTDDENGVCYDDKFLLIHQQKEKDGMNDGNSNVIQDLALSSTNETISESLSSNIVKSDNTTGTRTSSSTTKNKKSKSTKPTTLVTTMTSTQATFYNCGYATWVQVRHAWKNPNTFLPTPPAPKSMLSQPTISNLKSDPEKHKKRNKRTNNNSSSTKGTNNGCSKNKSSSTPKVPSQAVATTTTTVFVPDSVKRDLVKCIKERRHFELSRSIPLKIIITAYNEAWAEGEGL
jgi:hypothetical protein